MATSSIFVQYRRPGVNRMKSYTCTPLYYIYALFIMHKALFRAKKIYPMSVS